MGPVQENRATINDCQWTPSIALNVVRALLQTDIIDQIEVGDDVDKLSDELLALKQPASDG